VLKGTRKLVEREISCPPDFIMMMRVTPLIREAGGAVVLMVDVSESSRRNAEAAQNRERLASLFDALEAPQCTIASDGKVKRANSAFAAMVGSTSAGVTGRPLSDFLSAGADKVPAALETVAEKGLVRLEAGIGGKSATATLAASCTEGTPAAIDILWQL
jgi:PAS domain-containing protein